MFFQRFWISKQWCCRTACRLCQRFASCTRTDNRNNKLKVFAAFILRLIHVCFCIWRTWEAAGRYLSNKPWLLWRASSWSSTTGSFSLYFAHPQTIPVIMASFCAVGLKWAACCWKILFVMSPYKHTHSRYLFPLELLRACKTAPPTRTQCWKLDSQLQLVKLWLKNSM